MPPSYYIPTDGGVDEDAEPVRRGRTNLSLSLRLRLGVAGIASTRITRQNYSNVSFGTPLILRVGSERRKAWAVSLRVDRRTDAKNGGRKEALCVVLISLLSLQLSITTYVGTVPTLELRFMAECCRTAAAATALGDRVAMQTPPAGHRGWQCFIPLTLAACCLPHFRQKYL
jgi:hypothetical protein